MTFQVGSRVIVTKLRRRGEVIAILPNGRLRIALGSITTFCSPGELQLDSNIPVKAASDTITVRDSDGTPIKTGTKSGSLKLDLHGNTVSEALALLDQALNRCILDGHIQLEVVHGIGSGALMRAVHEYCCRSPVVAKFAIAPRNTGTTIVYL